MSTLHTIAFTVALCLAIHVIGSKTYAALKLVVDLIVDKLVPPPGNK